MELEFPPDILAACGRHRLELYVISNDISVAEVLAARQVDPVVENPEVESIGQVEPVVEKPAVKSIEGAPGAITRNEAAALALAAANRLWGYPTADDELVIMLDELAHAVDRRFRHYLGVPGWLGGCLVIPIAEHRTGVALHHVNPALHIGKLTCPVFIISGDKDTKTWPQDTQRLFEAAREPKELWMIEAGHQDLFSPAYESRVLAFLNKNV